jgi:hypothetical protein
MGDDTDITQGSADGGDGDDSQDYGAAVGDDGSSDDGSEDGGSYDDAGDEGWSDDSGDGSSEDPGSIDDMDYSAYLGSDGNADDQGADSDTSGELLGSATDSFASSGWEGLKRAGRAVGDLTMAGYDGARKAGVALQQGWHGLTDADDNQMEQDRIHRYNLNAAEQSRLHNAKIDLGLTDPNDTWREEDPEEAYGV